MPTSSALGLHLKQPLLVLLRFLGSLEAKRQKRKVAWLHLLDTTNESVIPILVPDEAVYVA